MNSSPGNQVPRDAQLSLPPAVADKIEDMVRDARLAILVGFIPILGIAFTVRLVQWYQLRRRYPVLARLPADASQGDRYTELYIKAFRSVRTRFWFAVLFWPLLFLIILLAFFSIGLESRG